MELFLFHLNGEFGGSAIPYPLESSRLPICVRSQLRSTMYSTVVDSIRKAYPPASFFTRSTPSWLELKWKQLWFKVKRLKHWRKLLIMFLYIPLDWNWNEKKLWFLSWFISSKDLISKENYSHVSSHGQRPLGWNWNNNKWNKFLSFSSKASDIKDNLNLKFPSCCFTWSMSFWLVDSNFLLLRCKQLTVNTLKTSF